MSKKQVEEETEELPEPQRRDIPLAAWAGALLVLAALFAVAAVVAFGSMGRSSIWGWAFSALGVFSLLGWFLGRRGTQQIKADQHSKQRALLGVNSFLSVLLMLILLVGVNYLAARRHKTFDLTQNKINSLSPQTQKALDKLKAPVVMSYIYYKKIGDAVREPNPSAVSVLDTYKNASDKVKIEYVNAAYDVAKMESLDPGATFNNFSPLLIIQSTGKDAAKQQATNVDEQNITSALMKLGSAKAATLYFLSGHGELSPDAAGEQSSISQAKAALENQNYTLKNLSLLQGQSAIPTNAAAIIVAEPRVDLAARELKALTDYANGKGRLVLLLGPTAQPLPNWNKLAKTLGVEAREGFVVAMGQGEYVESPQNILAATQGNRHPLLRGVPENVGVVLPKARALQTQTVAGKTITPLYESSAQSALVSNGQIDPSARGPFVLAAAMEPASAQPEMPGAPPPSAPEGARAVVVGNADFIRDGAYELFSNGPFFLAAVNWTVGNEDLITIPPKPPTTNKIDISDSARLFAILIGLFVLPILTLIFGTVVWWKRR